MLDKFDFTFIDETKLRLLIADMDEELRGMQLSQQNYGSDYIKLMQILPALQEIRNILKGC